MALFGDIPGDHKIPEIKRPQGEPQSEDKWNLRGGLICGEIRAQLPPGLPNKMIGAHTSGSNAGSATSLAHLLIFQVGGLPFIFLKAHIHPFIQSFIAMLIFFK